MREEGTTEKRSGLHRVIRHPVLWTLVSFVVIAMVGWTLARPEVLDQIGAPLDAVSDILNPGSTDHVIVISIDGLRPDAIDRFDAETLQRLMRDGRFTLLANTIVPPKTLPSHASMLTGTPPAVHGITWNEDMTGDHGYVRVPTIFGTARRRGLETAAFFSKTKFEHLAQQGDFDFLQRPRGGILNIPAGDVENAVEDYLESNKPNLLFVHLADVDFAGHRFGWMSYIYGRAVRVADDAVGEIVDDANAAFGCGNYTLIVTADHGGHGRNHGLNQPSDRLIPWITWGKAVKDTGPIAQAVNTMDTAATALWLLGITPPAIMEGRPVTEAFADRPSIVAPSIDPRPTVVRGCS